MVLVKEFTYTNTKNEDYSKKDLESVHDPKKTGPGVWYAIHTAAKNMSFDDFLRFIHMLARDFFCANCQVHFKSYLDNNDLEPYRNMYVKVEQGPGKAEKSEKIGAFLWSWKFHNAVNARLKKPEMSWHTVCDLYNISKHEENCSATCSESL